jgi:hypothetical protein
MLQLAPRGEIAVPMVRIRGPVPAGCQGAARIRSILRTLPGRSAAHPAWLENVLPPRHYVCFGSLADIHHRPRNVR